MYVDYVKNVLRLMNFVPAIIYYYTQFGHLPSRTYLHTFAVNRAMKGHTS